MALIVQERFDERIIYNLDGYSGNGCSDPWDIALHLPFDHLLQLVQNSRESPLERIGSLHRRRQT